MARAAVLALVAAATLAGCATTRVTTTERDARIWFDGRPVGERGEVVSTGPPHTARVLVVAKDGRRARALVARRPTAALLSRGLWTFGACLVLCWEYPPEVFVPLPPARVRPAWDDDAPDAAAWLRPPPDRWSLPPPSQPPQRADPLPAAHARGGAVQRSSP